LNGPFLFFEASFLRQYIAASNSFADKFDSLKGKNPTIQSEFYGCIQLRKNTQTITNILYKAWICYLTRNLARGKIVA